MSIIYRGTLNNNLNEKIFHQTAKKIRVEKCFGKKSYYF